MHINIVNLYFFDHKVTQHPIEEIVASYKNVLIERLKRPTILVLYNNLVSRVKLNLFFQNSCTPILIGVLSFVLVVGATPLNPRNIAWLDGGGDSTTYYLGWAFYRYGPWSFPLGLNPLYGLNIGSSIVFSDSIPLLALILKPFSSWLSDPFQYLGIWLFICFLLQAYFSWLLVGLINQCYLFRVLSTCLIVFAPPMLFRVFMHAPLASHFIVLAALYLNLRSQKNHRVLAWLALLAASVLINFYLFAMAFALWITNLVDGVWAQKTISKNHALLELIGISALITLCFWQGGYLELGSSGVFWGFGFYRMNLFSLFNPMGWSHVLDVMYQSSIGDYEGFNYLGLGLIGLLAVTIFKIPLIKINLWKHCTRHPALVLVLIGLTVLAITNQVGIGSFNFIIPISPNIESLLNIFRSSGRLFWPVWYLFVLVILFSIDRITNKKTVTIILFCAVFVQIIDTSAKWWPRRMQAAQLSGPELPTNLTNPFWSIAGSHYHQVKRIPVIANQPNWHILATYAAQYQMGVNTVYLARIDEDKVQQANRLLLQQLESGKWDQHTLYVLDDELVPLVMQKIHVNQDFFAKIDGQNILAPEWMKCSSCVIQSQEIIEQHQLFQPVLGQKIFFNQKSGRYDFVLPKGWWTWPESWGVWSIDHSATLRLLLPLQNPKKLILSLRALVSPAQTSQNVFIIINGKYYKSVRLANLENNLLEIPIDNRVSEQGYIAVDFALPNAVTPKELRIGDDDRKLAIGLEWAQFQ